MGGSDWERGGKKYRVSLDSSTVPSRLPLVSPTIPGVRGRDVDDEGANRVRQPELERGRDGGRISSSRGSISSS